MQKWEIFIITHKNIFSSMYFADPQFSKGHYKFINVSKTKLSKNYSLKYNIINMNELPRFSPLGAYYAESEAIYNLYKNKNYYAHLDYIGFIHYDFELYTGSPLKSVTRCIEEYISGKPKAHISFATFDFNTIYGQRILADVNHPERFIGEGYNCIDYILYDYNRYFDTRFSKKKLSRKGGINLCSAFLIDCPTFVKMMRFCACVIETGKLNVFDPLHQNRHQGNLLERYYGVFLSLEYKEFLTMNLPHHTSLKFQ